jgi:hypothetical protein
MKMKKGVKMKLQAFITSELDGSERSASRSGCFTPEIRVPGTQWIGE